MPRARKTKLGSINPSSPSSPGGALPSTPTGLRYGENKQLADAQAAVPQGGTPAPALAAPGPADMMTAAQNFIPPNVGLGAPSARPYEHVTTGGDQNPSALLTNAPAPGTLADMLRMAAQASGSSSLAALADRATQLGQ